MLNVRRLRVLCIVMNMSLLNGISDVTELH